MNGKYYVTFSEKYRSRVHPMCGSDVSPDGYVTVYADSLDEAHLVAHREFNAYYSGITEDQPELPEGELWTLS